MTDSPLLNAKILIVDDKQSNVDLLKDLLEDTGYKHIKSITDSRLAVGLFESFKPDLILLDLMMPYLDGFEVMGQLKALIPKATYLPILVLTADLTTETKLQALSHGAKDFLSKPFDLYEVRLRIENLLETRFLYQLLENQNQVLDEKVRERTKELELSNKELTISRDKAEESNRLKTAFLNNISHEIRTPLNGILGFAPFIIQPGISQEEKEEFLNDINESSTRLMNTITDIMDMSMIVSDNLKVNTSLVDVSTVLQNLTEKFSRLCAKKNLKLVLEQPALPPYINLITDESLLTKSLSHLLNNAVKFTSNGCITLGCMLKDGQLEFYVKDTGIGIAKEAQQRIVEFFMQENYSNSRTHEGNGLGLSVAAGLINLLGGKLHLESEKEAGTTVAISMPVNIDTDQHEDIYNPEKVELKKLSCVLVAEDDELSSQFLETLLRKIAITVLKATTGTKTVEICRKNPDIDVILMDIKMSEMDGYEATREIRLFNKEVIIIAQTAYGLTGDKRQAIESGCNDYVSKPVNRGELLTLLGKYFLIENQM